MMFPSNAMPRSNVSHVISFHTGTSRCGNSVDLHIRFHPRGISPWKSSADLLKPDMGSVLMPAEQRQEESAQPFIQQMAGQSWTKAWQTGPAKGASSPGS